MAENPGRKLSPREQARCEALQRLSDRMKEQGYRRVDLVVDVVQANGMAVVIMLPFLVAAAVIFFALGELYYQVQHFRKIKRSSYRTLVE